MIDYVVKDVGAVLRYLPYGIVVGILVAIILSAVNDRRVRRKKKPIPVAAVTSFFMYVVIMLFITFLSRESGSRTGKVDLKLFSTWGINGRNRAFVMENVLLFIPYGFVCAWAIRPARKFLTCTALGLLTSLGIECMQLYTARGYFQIDDILTNTLGAMIGYVLFRCVLNEEHTGSQRARLVYVFLAGIMMCAMIVGIVAFSSDRPEQSNATSVRVTEFVVDKSGDWLNMDLTAAEHAAAVKFLNPILRKMAHASEYAALSIVVGFGYQMMKRKRAKVVNYFYAVMMCGLIALADEALQKYVFARGGRMMDVFIDVLGAIVGGCVYIFLSELFAFLAGEEAQKP